MIPAPDAARPRSRLRLYLPAGLLLLLALLWSVGWLVVRARVASEADAWLDRERAAGRTWTCPDRAVGGYPFRVEVVCPSLAFAREDFAWTLGRVVAVAQVYQPTHLVLEAAGPLAVSRGPVTASANWRLLQASVQVTARAAPRLERLSVAVDDLSGSAVPPAANPGAPVTFGARRVEFHARPNPGRFEGEGAVDLSLRADAATAPSLDPLLGGSEPADVALDATASRAAGLGGAPLPVELERWRAAGGALDVTRVALDKGSRHVRVRGALGLDAEHRLSGRLSAEAAGLEAILGPLLGPVLGGRLGGERGAALGGLVGGLLGALRPRGSGEREAGGAEAGARLDQAPGGGGGGGGADAPRLVPLPAVSLEGGRVRVGPFPLPVALLPLY